MKPIFVAAVLCASTFVVNAQQNDAVSSAEKMLQETSAEACKCIDSIVTSGKTQQAILADVSRCINKQVIPYQLGVKIAAIKLPDSALTDGAKGTVNIEIAGDENSSVYKKYYRELEANLMDQCPALKAKLAANDIATDKSHSQNAKAREYYDKGADAEKKEDYQEAIKQYKKALKEDPVFAFAWDNLGLCYRRTGEYDKAIEAYQESIKLDPTGKTPLQNIAVAYQHKKDYPKAIEAYEALAKLDKENPEVYYGLGQTYAIVKNWEKGLDNMCKAYNLYTTAKSPYRTDAEKIIQYIYQEMKKEGKETQFDAILKNNNLNPH